MKQLFIMLTAILGIAVSAQSNIMQVDESTLVSNLSTGYTHEQFYGWVYSEFPTRTPEYASYYPGGYDWEARSLGLFKIKNGISTESALDGSLTFTFLNKLPTAFGADIYLTDFDGNHTTMYGTIYLTISNTSGTTWVRSWSQSTEADFKAFLTDENAFTSFTIFTDNPDLYPSVGNLYIGAAIGNKTATVPEGPSFLITFCLLPICTFGMQRFKRLA